MFLKLRKSSFDQFMIEDFFLFVKGDNIFKMRLIDNFLNQITMYRLVFYYLIFLVLFAIGVSVFNLTAFSPIAILISAVFLVVVCLLSNKLLSRLFKAPINTESAYITGLILSLIITPASNFHDFMFLGVAGIAAMVGKYILFPLKKHIFNPAALAVVFTSIIMGSYASWWVGTTAMLPALLLGVLVVKKIKRFEMVLAFFVAALFYSLVQNSNDMVGALKNAFTETPILFFAFIMLVEPLTSPTRKNFQIMYGVLVGFLYSSNIAAFGYHMSPEWALLFGNLFSYVIGMKKRLVLELKEKIEFGDEIVHFIFNNPGKFSFEPGQYLEWTLPAKNTDSRGNRRYFTIASSPTEENISIGVKFVNNGSSFKKSLDEVGGKNKIVADQISGDFILPKDSSKKLVFIAGGIGITPFRSMIKYLIDTDQKRDIVLFYSNKIVSEIAYKDVFGQAHEKLGIKTIYTLTDDKSIPRGWSGAVGRISADIIKREVPDFKDRYFYLSGPHAMVVGYEDVLNSMGVARVHIIVDYFPGY